jgi:cytochrome P450 family 110
MTESCARLGKFARNGFVNVPRHRSPFGRLVIMPKPTATMLPPGPDTVPLLSTLAWVRDPLRYSAECARRFGDTFTLRFPGGPPFVVVSAPEDIKTVFTGDPDVFHAGEANFIVESLVGKYSLLILDGPAHLRERKLMMPPFHGERMRAYGEAMQALAHDAFSRARRGDDVRIHPVFQDITLDVILRTVFGMEDGPRQTALRASLLELLERGTTPALFAASIMLRPQTIQKILGFGNDPNVSPAWALRFGRFVPWAAIARAGMDVERILYQEFDRLRASLDDLAHRTDVLSMLIQARDESGSPMNHEHLRDEMITLLAAGHETTATTLAWVVHHVLAHPSVHRKIRSELDHVSGGQPLRTEHFASLPYLDAVIKETQRKLPIIGNVARKLKAPARIGRWSLPAEVFVAPSIYLAHHRPETWGDPESFRPERFLERKPEPYEFFPFGGGTRRCLGMAFAQYEMRIVLAELFSRWEVASASQGPIEHVRRGVTMAPSDNLRVRIAPRGAHTMQRS